MSTHPIHLVIKSGGRQAIPEWRTLFKELAPHVEVHDWYSEAIDKRLVKFALVWEPEEGRLSEFPQLQAVISSAAGVDHILRDPHLPAQIPIIRMVTEETQARMAQFCAMAALMAKNDVLRIVEQQRARQWIEFNPPYTAEELTVGILGLGTLGSAAATLLKAIGFQVIGWSKSAKQINGVESFSVDALPHIVRRSHILISILPDTAQTKGILSPYLLNELPKGAYIINVGRGTHLDELGLLQALDSGHLGGAILDVVDPEPLPEGSPLWRHPRILISPHTAATPSLRAKAVHAARSIAEWERGEGFSNAYCRQRGY